MSDHWATLTFEFYPGRALHVLAVSGSTARLVDEVLARSVDCAVIDAALVADSRSLHLAANKALYAAATGKLRAATVHLELVFALHGGKNVGEALRALGATGDSRAAVIGVFDATPAQRAAVDALVDGAAATMADVLAAHADAGRIRALYRIDTVECGTLGDAVASRTALQDVGTT